MRSATGTADHISLKAAVLLYGKRLFALSGWNVSCGAPRVRNVYFERSERLQVVYGDSRRVGSGCVSLSHERRRRIREAASRVESIAARFLGGSRGILKNR